MFELVTETDRVTLNVSTPQGWQESARVEGMLVDRAMGEIMGLLRGTGLTRSDLRPGAQVSISEATGVRLRLLLEVLAVVNSRVDSQRAVAELNSMSVEEAYYWYAKVLQPRGRAALFVLVGAVDE